MICSPTYSAGPAEPPPEPLGRGGGALNAADFFYLEMILIRVTTQH